MATKTLITLEEYHQRYAGENGYEYWFGEVSNGKILPLTSVWDELDRWIKRP